MDASPQITAMSWGRVELADGSTYKDAKLFPGGSRAWDWNETGTRHAPGIQPADIEELLDRGADVVVLSRGVLRRLQVQQETVDALELRGVEVHVLPTERAVERYNELAAGGRAVAGLFHSTC